MKRRKELTAQEWSLLGVLQELILTRAESKMSVKEWRKQKIKELKPKIGEK